jgi:hypothetical protein
MILKISDISVSMVMVSQKGCRCKKLNHSLTSLSLPVLTTWLNVTPAHVPLHRRFAKATTEPSIKTLGF